MKLVVVESTGTTLVVLTSVDKLVPVNERYETCGYRVSYFLFVDAYTELPPPIELPAA